MKFGVLITRPYKYSSTASKSLLSTFNSTLLLCCPSPFPVISLMSPSEFTHGGHMFANEFIHVDLFTLVCFVVHIS